MTGSLTNNRTGVVHPHDRPDAASLSCQLWDLDWNEHFPIELPGGVRFEPSSFERAQPFIEENLLRIFPDEEDSPFRQLDGLAAKARYYALSDVFAYVHEGRTIGLVVGNPVDWSTYYCRTTAILPEYQRRGLGDAWFEPLFRVLAGVGVERVEGHVAPTNLPMLRMLTRNGFQVMGNLLTDRWGALLQVVLFLDKQRDQLFKTQFCPSFVRSADAFRIGKPHQFHGRRPQ